MSKLLNRLGDYLLEKAFASEYKQAGLVVASVQLSFGHTEYLKKEDASGQMPEAIVMLHGAAADKTSWTRFTKYLVGNLAKTVFAKTPFLIPDLPGHGNSFADINLDYSIHAQAERLKELLSALGIKRVHLIGNSMGSAIAIHIAATSPELVSSLVLIDSAGCEASPSWLRQHIASTGINARLGFAFSDLRYLPMH